MKYLNFMKRSHYFLPTLKETPAEAQIASHILMLRAGMVHKTAAGIYSWLPMGSTVLKKIEDIIRQEQNNIGAHEVIMPTIQPGELWRKSGRYDVYGDEMLRIKDRHGRDMLYAPTAEEVITEIFGSYSGSYRDLPCMLYQIHWKFRDEIRPRFGVMRGREFLMKDAYSFDLDQKSAEETYMKQLTAYIKTFARMGLTAIPVRADTGPIGGDLSHEFQIVAQTGESQIYYDAEIDTMRTSGHVDPVKLRQLYSAADEMHDSDNCPVPPERLKTARGIEVGHIFYFGTKYTKAMDITVLGADGKPFHPHMGSYGIGTSRLVGAVIEANHDEKGIIWPTPIAPFKVGIINLKAGDGTCDTAADKLYQQMTTAGLEPFLDDTDDRAGVKFATMDLIGLPWQVILGPKGIQAGTVEIKCRRTDQREEIPLENAVSYLVEKISQV